MKKLIIVALFCVVGINTTHAQSIEKIEYTLLVKEVIELERFSKKDNGWRVTFGKKTICYRHGGSKLLYGQYVNFCQNETLECGEHHIHHTFRFDGGVLVLVEVRISDVHTGKMLKRFKPHKLDSKSKERLESLHKLYSMIKSP